MSEEWKQGLTNEEVDKRIAAWGLEETPVNRERYRAKRGETETVTFRMASQNHRILQEVLAQQIDPSIKTMSDILQDAVGVWIERHLLDFADGPHGRTLRVFRLEQRQNERDARQRFLDHVDKDVDNCRIENDNTGLVSLLGEIHREYDEVEEDVPKSYLRELDKRIEHIERIIR